MPLTREQQIAVEQMVDQIVGAGADFTDSQGEPTQGSNEDWLEAKIVIREYISNRVELVSSIEEALAHPQSIVLSSGNVINFG